jgi:hypothetical protein
VDFSFLLLRRRSSVAMEGGDERGNGREAKPSEGPLVEPIEFFNPGIPLISFLISFGTASLLVGGGGVRYGDSIGESPMTRQPAVPNVQNRTDLVLTICKMALAPVTSGDGRLLPPQWREGRRRRDMSRVLLWWCGLQDGH